MNDVDVSRFDPYWNERERNTYMAPVTDAPRTAPALVYLQRALSLLDNSALWPDPLRERSMFKLRFGENRPNLAAIIDRAQDNRAPDDLTPWSNGPFVERYPSEGWIVAKNALLAVTGAKDLEGLRTWCSPWWRSQRAVRRAVLQAMAKVNGYQ